MKLAFDLWGDPLPAISKDEAAMRAEMELSSGVFARALGLGWQCEHRRTPETTHTIAGREQCKVCRRRRWMRGFHTAMARRKQTRVRAKWMPNIARTPPKMAKDIIAAVCEAFGLTTADMMGSARNRQFVVARALAYRLLRDRKWEDGSRRYSLPMIGSYFGGKDHSTIKHALDRFDIYCRQHPDVAAVYEALRGVEGA